MAAAALQRQADKYRRVEKVKKSGEERQQRKRMTESTDPTLPLAWGCMAAWPSAKYLPYTAVRQAWIQESLLPVTGTCGKALPVTVLRLRYKGNYYQTFTFEKQVNAQKALDTIRAGAPDAVFAPEPVGEQRAAFLASLTTD